MEAALAIADVLRRETVRPFVRIESLRRVLLNPRKRIPAVAFACICCSALFAAFAPVSSLSIGAALLGVPHVVSGLRQVGMRRQLHPITKLIVAATVGLGIVSLIDTRSWTFSSFGLLFSAAAATELVAARARGWRTFLVGALVISAGVVPILVPNLFVIMMTHLHAVGSIIFFLICARRRGINSPIIAVGLLIVVGACLCGILDPLLSTISLNGTGPDSVVEILGTSYFTSASALKRSLFLYAFGQSFHYSIWLRLMPEVDRQTPIPQGFVKAWRLLHRDLGVGAHLAVVVSLLASAAMLLGGNLARQIYFTLVYFHVGLEAAGLARHFLHGREEAFPEPRSRESAVDLRGHQPTEISPLTPAIL